MRYSLWFPTHGVEAGSLRGFLNRLFVQPAYRLDAERQSLVSRAISELCVDRGWKLLEVKAGEYGVSATVESNVTPERIIHDFKIAASLALAFLDGDGPDRKRFNRRAHYREVDPAAFSMATAAAVSRR